MPFMSSLAAGDSHAKSWLNREVLYEYTNEENAVYLKKKVFTFLIKYGYHYFLIGWTIRIQF